MHILLAVLMLAALSGPALAQSETPAPATQIQPRPQTAKFQRYRIPYQQNRHSPLFRTRASQPSTAVLPRNWFRPLPKSGHRYLKEYANQQQ